MLLIWPCLRAKVAVESVGDGGKDEDSGGQQLLHARRKILLDRTQIRKGIQAILLKVIEFGRFNKSSHPEDAQGCRQIMRDETSKSNAADTPAGYRAEQNVCSHGLSAGYTSIQRWPTSYMESTAKGAGHSTRSREIILHLQRQGHSVVAASFDRGLRNLSDICEVQEIHGFRFTYVNNQVRYNRTLARNLFHARKATRGIKDLVRLIDERGNRLVITDFEPLTCRAGRRRKLPVISIDNQHILTHFNVATPPHYRTDATAAKMLTRLMTPYASHYLVTSFFDAPSRRRNSELVPPILRQQIQDAVPSADGPILVYVTSPAPQLIKLLASVRAEFIAYGFGREGREGNILYKKPGFESFFDDLASRPGDYR